MTDANDIALLREYARCHSEAAFTELVRRHIHLVYSVALRCTGNDSDAQDVAQAVFIILARKAAGLHEKTLLAGWLYEATRFTAARLRRDNARRHAREQEAYMQSTLNEAEAASIWEQLSPHLEGAMSRLAERDRALLVLRFYQNKTGPETAALLGLRENTLHKRVARALEKLRMIFAKQGVTLSGETIAGAISAHSIQAAPAGLANTISTVALAKSTVASISTSTLVKTTLLAMKTKTIIATAAAVVVILGAGVYFASHSKRAGKSSNAHIALANDAAKRDANDPLFEIGVDPDTHRASNSPPAIYIKGPTRPAADAAEKSADEMLQKRGNSSSMEYVATNDSPFLGKRIRITGWIKCKDVQNWAAAYMCVWSKDLGFCRFDAMKDRNTLSGTMDWQKVEFVTDVPNEPCEIYAGPDLYGPGELWGDDFRIDLAPGAAINDDRAWHLADEIPNNYSEENDYLVMHNGHPTVCVASISSTVPPGASASWTKAIRTPDFDKYKGHLLRMSGWVKAENVSGHFEPWIRVWGKGGRGNKSGHDSLTGTLDWTQFTVTCAITEETHKIDASFILSGSGKVWIDMDSVKFEVVK